MYLLALCAVPLYQRDDRHEADVSQAMELTSKLSRLIKVLTGKNKMMYY